MPDTHDWEATAAWIRRHNLRGPWPGTEAWFAASTQEKLGGLAQAGAAWVLSRELAELARSRSMKDAALEISEAVDWSAEAQFILRRSTSAAYIPRQVAR